MIYRKCKNCFHKFSNRQIIQSVWLGYAPIDCKVCGARFYPTFLTRTIIGVCIPTPILIINWLNYFNGHILLMYFAWLGFVVLITPYIATYKVKTDKKENAK